MIQLLCFGFKWLKRFSHIFDATIVIASLVLELVLRSSQYEDVVGLLIVFRLWRIVRVLHAAEEVRRAAWWGRGRP
jgi:hypothetical protein